MIHEPWVPLRRNNQRTEYVILQRSARMIGQ